MAVTPNLSLHQWQSGDSFLREDFNEDFSKIDGAAFRCASGTFVGDGTDNREIITDFRPKLLIIYGATGSQGSVIILGQECFFSISYGGMVYPSLAASADYRMTDRGFMVLYASVNRKGSMGYYIALG